MMSKVNKKGINLPHDYPFLPDVHGTVHRAKETWKTYTADDDGTEKLHKSKMSTFSGQWIKVYSNRDAFEGLSPYASQLFIHILHKIEYETVKVNIKLATSGMSKRTFPKALLELTLRRIIQKDRREWYWFNVSVVCKGVVNHPYAIHNEDGE